jgi:UDP-N-acetylglucosamine--N-acetylmuramyl-(pentapeptide) pyrophosphoryl-undecaprenol N-acetylglucosamine transferase
VYPALAVLQAIQTKRKLDAVLWVGGEGGMETDLVTRAGVPYKTIPAAGVHGIGPRALPGNLWQLGRGVAAARQILSSFKPDVLLYTGGYVAAPMAVAGWRTPALLYVPDIQPGYALRFLSLFARTIALTSPESGRYFNTSARLEVTGYPTRPELLAWNRSSGRSHLGLGEELPVLLVTGGSKGARTLNLPVLQTLPGLLQICQIVHISGSLDWEAVQQARAALPAALQERYHIYAYLHEMGAALAAADLVISRAGASALGEYPLFGLPAILVPYQYAWRYQQVNAEYLQANGAALILQASQLAAELLPTIQHMLAAPGRLESMRTAMRSLAHPDAAHKIGDLLTHLVDRPDLQEGK